MQIAPTRSHRNTRIGWRALRFAATGLLPALAFGGVIACNDSGGPDGPAATVLLAGVPAEAMRVGSTAQLSATALSGTGSMISGANVLWKSSNEGVATVSSGGLVTARSAGIALVTAWSGSGTATAEILVVAPLVLSSGRTVSLPDGSLSLVVPFGGAGTTTLLVGPGPASLADEQVAPGTIFQIALDTGAVGYLNGVVLKLRYDPERLPEGTTGAGLQIYRRTASGWVPIPGSASDTAQKVVSGAFYGSGTYSARFSPVDRLLLSGAHLDGALYVGQSAQLGVAAVTATGDTLPHTAISWSTSAAGVATVDAQGTVSAVAPGMATITASAGTLSASTPMPTLPRPIASWTGTLDWTTYRGNNRRTGYVDVTLDPVTFARRWEVTVSGAASPLNEAATGYGNIYVSSDSYYGTQGVWALDAATGITRWTRAFGSISSVNGPATGNGRVYLSTGGHQDSFLWSFDAADGTVLFRSPYDNQWSRWKAPAVTPDIVFLGGGYYGGMSAFKALDGALLWKRSLAQVDWWTPAAAGDKAYAFGSESPQSGLLVLDGRTGAATVAAPNAGLPNAGTPVVGTNDDAYAAYGNRLLGIDLQRNVVAWDLPGAYQGPPALDANHVYAVINGQVEARRRTDGSLVWMWVPQEGAAAVGSMIVTRNLLFVRLVPGGSANYVRRVVALDLAARKVVWSYNADGEIVLGDGLLIVTHRSSAKVTAIAVR